MTYPQTLAELNKLKDQLKETAEPRLRKHYKKQIKRLEAQCDEYETSFYGKKLGN